MLRSIIVLGATAWQFANGSWEFPAYRTTGGLTGYAIEFAAGAFPNS